MKTIKKLNKIAKFMAVSDDPDREEFKEILNAASNEVQELYAALTLFTICPKIITSKNKDIRKAYDNAKKVLGD